MAEVVSTQIRIPASLHRKLAKAAEASRRSLNEEIVWRLQNSLAALATDVEHEVARLKTAMEEMQAQIEKTLAQQEKIQAQIEKDRRR